MAKKIITIGLAFIAANSFAQSDVAKANWAPVVKVDGNADEWAQPLRFYDNDSKLFYSFVNDDKTLYLCFATDDEVNQAKIMRAGIKVSLSTKTKDKHKVSIDFPVIAKAEDSARTEEKPRTPGQKFDRGDFKTAFLAHHTTMEIKGFSTKDGVININDNSGINVAMNWDAANKCIYEVAIPLKELYGEGYTADDIAKDISLTAEINALKKGEGGDKAYNGRGGGGGGRMGGGRMGGGRMGGGRGGGNRGASMENNTEEKTPDEITAQHTSMYEKSEVKQKFDLATKQ